MKRHSSPPARSGITFFGQGPAYCAVCASRGLTQSEVEAEVAKQNAGTAAWKAVTGPLLIGRGNPRSCPLDHGRQHWLVVRAELEPVSQLGS